MKREMNKRGADLTITMIILIVIGLFVLAMVILGFTGTWNTLLNKLNIYGGNANSISDVGQACSLACAQGAAGKAGFCVESRLVKGLTVEQIKSLGGKDGDKEISVTCKKLATEKLIDDCSITCP